MSLALVIEEERVGRGLVLENIQVKLTPLFDAFFNWKV